MARIFCLFVTLGIVLNGCATLQHTTRGRSWETVVRDVRTPAGTQLNLLAKTNHDSGAVDFEILYQPRCVIERQYTRTDVKNDHYKYRFGSWFPLTALGTMGGMGAFIHGTLTGRDTQRLVGVGVALASVGMSAILANWRPTRTRHVTGRLRTRALNTVDCGSPRRVVAPGGATFLVIVPKRSIKLTRQVNAQGVVTLSAETFQTLRDVATACGGARLTGVPTSAGLGAWGERLAREATKTPTVTTNKWAMQIGPGPARRIRNQRPHTAWEMQVRDCLRRSPGLCRSGDLFHCDLAVANADTEAERARLAGLARAVRVANAAVT